MKKMLAMILSAMILVTSILVVAAETKYIESTHKMTVNGDIVLSRRYNIEGQTYVNIRDIAHIYDKFVLSGGENRLIISDSLPQECPCFEEYSYCGIPCYDFADMLDAFKSHRIIGSFVWTYLENGKWYEVWYYPHFSVPSTETENGYLPIKTGLCFSTPLKKESERPVRSYIPKEIYEKFNAERLFVNYDINKNSMILVNGEHSGEINCVYENGEIYMPVRSLAAFFGFDVEFNNDTVVITDSNIGKELLPEGINVYIVDGVKFLYSGEIEAALTERGLKGGLQGYPYGRERTAPGYYIESTHEFGKESTIEVRFNDHSVPYINYADTPEEARERKNILLMLDYFKNTEIFE